MYFYLKEPKSEKETLIIVQYSGIIEKGNFKYSTSEKINPKDWSFENKLPVTKKGLAGAKLKKITTSILKFHTFLEQMVDNLKLNHTPISKVTLKEAFDKKFKKKVVQSQKGFSFFTDFVDDFIVKAPTLTNRTTKKKYTQTKIKHYKKTNNRIKDFEAFRKSRIKTDGFTLGVYDEFINYLTQTKDYSVNYAGDLIKNTKKFLKVAEQEFNYEVHPDYKGDNFTVIKEESVSIALSEQEITSLLEYDFSQDQRLENCRDLAIIGFWTGLRVSDFLSLPKINLEDRFITVQPKKTKDSSGIKVVIPLHHEIKEVLTKRGMPRMISDAKFNEYIKLVCKRVGLNDLVKGSLMVKNEVTEVYRKKVGMYAKYRLVSSHTCRRSFATNLYHMGFPTISIMNITGHTTEKSFLTYIKVTPLEHAEKLLKYWENYYALKNNLAS